MKYNPSAFYANFSLPELVKRNKSALRLEDAGGEIGGGVGGSGGPLDGSRPFHYQKSESISFQIRTYSEADQREFLSVLRTDLQNEIATRGAQINSERDLVGGFQIEYSEEGIQGCIEISGKFSGATYYTVNARLAETSTSEKRPLVETQRMGRKPQGTYDVVAFKSDDPRASSQEFLGIAQRTIKESTEKVKQLLRADYSKNHFVIQNLQYAEIYSWQPLPPEIKQRWEEAMGDELYVPAEYDRFAAVYFLNEVALKLYQQAGVDFEVFKTISQDEMPRLPGPSLRGPYLPIQSDL